MIVIKTDNYRDMYLGLNSTANDQCGTTQYPFILKVMLPSRRSLSWYIQEKPMNNIRESNANAEIPPSTPGDSCD